MAQMKIRLSQELKQWVVDRATKSKRTMNAEINFMIELAKAKEIEEKLKKKMI